MRARSRARRVVRRDARAEAAEPGALGAPGAAAEARTCTRTLIASTVYVRPASAGARAGRADRHIHELRERRQGRRLRHWRHEGQRSRAEARNSLPNPPIHQRPSGGNSGAIFVEENSVRFSDY